jgi:hypothetical protein
MTQPDHAHLARAIMEHCELLATHQRREEILHAIGEHDNGWIEEDAAPRVNPVTGDVFDFMTAPVPVRQGIWPRGVARLAATPWAAALVAQHALTIFERYRHDPEWDAFFNEIERARSAMLRESGLSLDTLLADYPFVNLGDVVSLTFCNGWTEEQRSGRWTVVLSGERLVVRPDPFGGVEIPIAINARPIHRQRFRSDAELREAFRDAPATRLTGIVAGP